MKRFTRNLFLVIAGLGFFVSQAQSPGDTIVVQSLVHSSNTRDTVVQFPTDQNLTFEKVIMLYNMRCKDALVSTGTDRNKGCGEWDYSNNTFISDSSHVDSVTATHPNYIISGFSGTSFAYTQIPTNTYYLQVQKSVTVNSATGEDTSALGTGTDALTDVVKTSSDFGKTQFIFTPAELLAAGVTMGDIDAMSLNVASSPTEAKTFRIRIKGTTSTSLDAANPDLTGFTEVYFANTNFVAGDNKFQFYTPYAWNGTDHLIVEVSFTNKTTAPDIVFNGDSVASAVSMNTYGKGSIAFDGSNYVEADNYYGILGGGARTVEAWIRTTVAGKEIVSWGTNANNEKYILRLDGQGRPRAEFNGSNIVGTSVINDGNWHHIALVQLSSSVSSMNLFVDGVVETKSSSANGVINTTQGINVRITKGHHNFYWEGQVDEVRIWATALTQAEVQENMYKKVDASHPKYSALELYYNLDEATGTVVNDASPNGRNATIVNAVNWKTFGGIDHFYGWEESAKRPNTSFYQGTYNLTVSNDSVIDTIQNSASLVNEYQVYSKVGTVFSDSLGIIMQGNYWEALPENVYDEAGTVINTNPVTTAGTFTVTDLPYWKRNPSNFQIMSFVTPYGINLDLGQEGVTWTFDVTDFTPILKGKKRMYMTFGGQNQEEMDVKFLFIVGTPPRDVLDIQEVWKVESKSYTNIMAEAAFEPRDVMMNPSGDAFKMRTSITGHGQEGEFIPRTHYLDIDGGSKEFSWQVWKTCGLNPIYPQGGTWIYDRAGWCPGMATDIRENDITTLITPGQTALVDYGITAATGTSNYIVSNQLVTYGAPNFALDARIEDIITPSSKIEHSRIGTLCEGPKVVIKNTGSTTLTSVEINYWVNNAPAPETYSWTGNLAMGETEEVTLPTQNLWDYLTAANNIFYAEVNMPNGGTDGYPLNNKMSDSFDIPNVVPNDFYIWLKTNNAGYENSYELTDDAGNVILSRNGLASNTDYRDTLSLANGCYNLRLYDTGGDGISFWANSDGSGFMRLLNPSNGINIITFQPDFGSEINYSFTVNFPLAYEELNPITSLNVFPNPASERVHVEMENVQDADVVFYSATGQQMNVKNTVSENRISFETSGLAAGVYFIHVAKDGFTAVEKVMVLK